MKKSENLRWYWPYFWDLKYMVNMGKTMTKKCNKIWLRINSSENKHHFALFPDLVDMYVTLGQKRQLMSKETVKLTMFWLVIVKSWLGWLLLEIQVWSLTWQKDLNKHLMASRLICVVELPCELMVTAHCQLGKLHVSVPHFSCSTLSKNSILHKGEALWPRATSWKRLCQWDVITDSHTPHRTVLGDMRGPDKLRQSGGGSVCVCDVMLQHTRNLCVAAQLVTAAVLRYIQYTKRTFKSANDSYRPCL